MKKYLFYVGIYVSKAKLDINILDALTFKSDHFIIENNIKSVLIFIKKLDRKIDKECNLFCCENTGVYFVSRLIMECSANTPKKCKAVLTKKMNGLFLTLGSNCLLPEIVKTFTCLLFAIFAWITYFL